MSGETVGVTRQCETCGAMRTIEVSRAGFEAYVGGALIQVAFPELSADDRELLLNSQCGPCYDAMCERLLEFDGSEEDEENHHEGDAEERLDPADLAQGGSDGQADAGEYSDEGDEVHGDQDTTPTADWVDRLGRRVIFRYGHGEEVVGVVTSANHRYVFVRFGTATNSEACDPDLLRLEVDV